MASREPFKIPDVIYIKPKKDDIVRWSAARMSGGIPYIRVDKINEIIKEGEDQDGN